MVKVYFTDISNFDFNTNELPLIYDKQRITYIESINDAKRKKQSFFVWLLLEYVLRADFNVFKPKFSFVDEKWFLKNSNVKFSITHSENIVAISISDNVQAVGVDVEIVSDKILKLQKLFNNLNGNVDIKDFLTIKWTEKESKFKSQNKNNFSTCEIYDNNGSKYFLTVCCDERCSDFINVDIDTIKQKQHKNT